MENVGTGLLVAGDWVRRTDEVWSVQATSRPDCQPTRWSQNSEGRYSNMGFATLIIAIVGLALAGLAWWHAGGKQDVGVARKRLTEEIEQLRAAHRELSELFLFAIEEAYEESRETLQQTAEGMRQLKSEAIEGLGQELERITEQLRALQRRLDEGLKSARDTTLATAQSCERSLRRRVHRMQARGSLLYAKGAATLAIRWVRKEEFQRAEKRLDEATALLALARETLRADHAYDQQFEVVKRALAEATGAVRAKAQDVPRRVEYVLAETDKLLGALETEEQQAADKKAA